MKKKKDEKKEPTKRDKLMMQSKTGALAQDMGRDLIVTDGTIDKVVLNDLIVHLIMQLGMLMQQVFPNGPPDPSKGRTEGGLIVPGRGARFQ